jgi:hypothetical protein
MEMSGQFHAPADLLSKERDSFTHWKGTYVDPRAGLDSLLCTVMPLPVPGIEPQFSP